MGKPKQVEVAPPHTRIALRAAVRQSSKKRYEIAAEIGVTDRTLQRWLNGELRPTADQWAKTMRSCGLSPAACFLTTELGRPDLIGTQSYEYIDKFLHHIFTRLTGLEEAGEMPLDPRGAARDASLVSDSWHFTYQRRKRFLDEEYERSGLPPFRSK